MFLKLEVYVVFSRKIYLLSYPCLRLSIRNKNIFFQNIYWPSSNFLFNSVLFNVFCSIYFYDDFTKSTQLLHRYLIYLPFISAVFHFIYYSCSNHVIIPKLQNNIDHKFGSLKSKGRETKLMGCCWRRLHLFIDGVFL